MLPFKVAILDYAMDHRGEELTVESIMDGLKDTPYATESQFTKSRVSTYCDAFNQCGFFEKVNAEILDNGTLHVTYKLTDYAIKRAERFIPGRKN